MKRKYFYVFGLVFSLLLASCNIGLGEAIDTESPEIDITSPNNGAVIRDKFAIKGTYSDDGQIKSIKLSLNNNETGIIKSYEADFADNSYIFTVDPLKEGLKDGKYEANITITDTYGHSTKASKTYIIDNTAPVIILSRPESKKGSESFEMFGQEFKLEGRAHDDNNVNIEIQIFSKDDEKNPLFIEKFNRLSLTIDETVLNAKEKLEDYEKVYGKISTEKNETKELYCKIIASDESKRYPVSESEVLSTDNEGNKIDTYYLESEFEEVIRASYSATDLYKMINGTFDASGRQVDESIKIEDIQKLLENNKVTHGQFSLNPANNPSYEVTNFNAPLNKDGKDFEGEDYKLTRGSSITVKVNSGLDGTYILGKSLGVYVSECDDEGKILDKENKIWLIEPEIDEDGNTRELTEEQIASRKAALETQLSVEKSKSYTFKSIELKASRSGMMLGKKYLIFVSGYDTNKTKVSNFNKDYGFYFAPKDAAPTLTVTEPSANTTYLAKGATLKVSGTSKTEMGNPTIEILVNGKEVEGIEKADLEITENEDLSNISKFEYEIPASAFDQKTSNEYLVSIVAKLEGKETVKEKTVSYDVDIPEILIQSVNPVVAKNDKECVNKTINVKGSISDSFTGLQTNTLKYYVLQEEEEKLSGAITMPSNFTVEIDTEKLTDEKEMILKLYAEDKAGNVSEITETYFVDQSTDVPNVGPNDESWDAQIDSEEKLDAVIENSEQKNILKFGSSIIFKCVDDDGIGRVSVKQKNTDVITDEEIKGSPTETMISHVLPSHGGKVCLEVNVKDIFGAEKSQEVWLQVTGADPSVKTSVTPEYYTSATNVMEGTPTQITIKGVCEGSAPFNIEILDAIEILETEDGKSEEIQKYSSIKIKDESKDNSYTTWSHSFVPLKDDVRSIRYRVKDFWGAVKDTEVSFKVDEDAPTASVLSVDEDKISGKNKNTYKNEDIDITVYNISQIPIKVVANDKEGGSGLAVVSYSLTPEDKNSYNSLVLKNDVWTGFATCEWQGVKEITIRMEDYAGNITTKTIPVRIDTVFPSLLGADVSGTKLVNGKNDITVTISAADNGNNEGTEPYNSGISKVEIVKIGSNTPENPILATFNNNAYSLTIPKEELATGGVTVKVTDNALNQVENSMFTVQLDNTNPTISITDLNDADSSTDGIQINGTVTLTGTSNDDQGLAENSPVKLYYSKDGGTTYTSLANVEGTTSWSLDIDTTKDFGSIADGTSIILKAEVTDKAQNVSSIKTTVIVNQDTDRPIINLSNLEINGMTNSTPIWHKQKFLFGTVTDDDGTIKELYVSKDGTTWGNNLIKSGSWQEKTEIDGEEILYFKVIDAKGTEFISSGTVKPKISDGTITKKDDTNLYLKVDTTQPTIPYMWFRTTNPGTEADIAEQYAKLMERDTTTGWIVSDSLPTTLIGGPDSKLYVMYKAFDANGIYKTSIKCASVENSSENELYKYTTSTEEIKVVVFNAEELSSGTNKLVITAYDNATGDNEVGSYSRTFDMTVDNTKPTVRFGGIQNVYYGSENNSINGTMSDTNVIEELYIGLSRSETEEPTEYLPISDYQVGGQSWSVTFDGYENDEYSTSYHTDKLNTWLDVLYGEGTKEEDAVKPVCLWVYAMDERGNKSEAINQVIQVSPQGDKPSVKIEVPAQGDVTGGSVRIAGTTDIKTSSVDSVWVQIDPSYDAVEFAEDWKSKLEALIEGKDVPYSLVESPTYENENGNTTEIPELQNKWAIKANGTTSWNLVINGMKEFQQEGENKTIAVRVYAVSKTGKISVVDEISFIIDPKSPRIGNTTPLQLVQYDTAGNIIARMNYESGMWVKGEWYLYGSVEDESGISSISFGKKNETPKSLNELSASGEVRIGDPAKGEVIEVIDDAASNENNYILKLLVGSSDNSYGKLEYSLSVTEGGDDGKGAEQNIVLNYDNKTPVFDALLDDQGNEIYQSNGTYTVNGSFDEQGFGTNNQSGFNRIAMYFTREYVIDGNTKTYLVDPMQKGGNDGNDNRYEYTATEDQPDSNFIYEKNIYWRFGEEAADIINGEITVDSNDSKLLKNVRVGGLCMINEVIYRIQTVRGNVITIDKPIVNQANVNIYFAVAQVIDNTTVESGTTTAYKENSQDKDDDSHVNGDGDQMIEGVRQNGTTYNWTASIDSSLIYDGPITIHFVAFDAAGNMTYKKYSGNVSNNAPRIAGVSFGTDNNGNGVISDDDEMITAYSGWYNKDSENKQTGVTQNGKKANGQNVSVFNVGYNEYDKKWETALVVKGDVKVVPEIVGGNTGLGYSVMQGNTILKNYTDYKNVGHSSDGSIRPTKDLDLGIDLEITLTVKDFLDNSIPDGEKQFSFLIWDKTQGTTPGVNSQHADINIQMNVMLSDTVPPTVTMDPFYWESKDKNSLYQNSRENGHIELEDDLPNTFIPNNQNDSIMDTDPKVSGKITIEGTANDNVLLMQLGVKTSKDFGTTKTFGDTGYTPIAKRVNGTWESQGTLETNGWQFESVEETNTQTEGNTLKWKLHLDTEKVSGTAVADFKLQVQAKDRGSAALDANGDLYYAYDLNGNGNKSTEDSAQTETGALTNFYKMDIVPYITGVQTSLSKLHRTASVYGRSSIGNYPVYEGESVELTGFNLGDVKNYTVTEKGAYTHSVNQVNALNNVNNDNAKGTYAREDESIKNASKGGNADILANYYNRLPNNINNNKLNDNIEFDVWQFDSDAIKPISGNNEKTVMKINPVTGLVSFAFVNGPLYFSMGGKDTSHDYYAASFDFFTSVGYEIDTQGNTYGCAAGGDINSGEADKFILMTSRWGVSADGNTTTDWNTSKHMRHRYGSYNAPVALRLESIGQEDASDVNTFNKQRIKSPTFASSVQSGTGTTASTNLYMAYYDDMNAEIRFKYGQINSSEKGDFGNFVDRRTNRGLDSYDDITDVQVIAKNGTSRNAGAYVSLGVVQNNGDKVVVVWYDETNRALMYSYNETPTTDRKNTTDYAGWSSPVRVFKNTSDQYAAGEYCQLAVDANGGIHIAAYDPVMLDLVYAYSNTYKVDSSEGFKTSIVDSEGVVGQNITIDVGKISTTENAIPYIGYYSISCDKPKQAFLVDSSDYDAEGTTEDLFTGKWNVSLVPTKNVLNKQSTQYNKINIGLFKQNGVIVKSTDITTETMQNNSQSEEKSNITYGYESWGSVYGNGTNNAIMGYVIKINSSTSYIETAQMK